MPLYKIDRKKDGLQGYRVVCNKTIDGKKLRKERYVYGADAAKEALFEMENEGIESGAMLVDELVDLFLSQKECRESTKERLTRMLNRYIKGKFGRLDNVTISSVAKWKKDIGSLDLSLRTRQNIFKDCRSLFIFAVKRKLIKENPFDYVEQFKDTGEVKEGINYYTADEWRKYADEALSEANEKGVYKYYVFFSIAYGTGMRKGEINALKWSDIEGNRISVRRSVCQKIKGKAIVETAPKTKSSVRTLQMPKWLCDILAEEKARQMQDRRWTEDRRVVGNTDIVSDTSIELANKRFAEKAGLHHIRIHDFRHSHASLLANAGINIQEVARRLGHTDVKITWNLYSHLYPQEEERAVAVLDRIY